MPPFLAYWYDKRKVVGFLILRTDLCCVKPVIFATDSSDCGCTLLGSQMGCL